MRTLPYSPQPCVGIPDRHWSTESSLAFSKTFIQFCSGTLIHMLNPIHLQALVQMTSLPKPRQKVR